MPPLFCILFFYIATAPFLCCVGLVASRLLSKPVGLSLG